ncbi:oligosaccharide flippase family protein [Nocardioides humi]|uniref:Membrane protein involved in the export of O-antigen and teichoic acid n=1 Tax=Nocardioides humi TaxID=449461 RepID=A0ABN2ARZ1_9ACTN|nr:oligosaccharide flippase family protein [Nocardioides humi]
MTDVTEQDDDLLRRTGAAIVTLAVAELLGKVATFVTFLLLARILGVAEFGVLSFGWSLGLLLAVFSSLGLEARLTQLGSARPDLLDRCYGALVGIRLVLSAAVLVPTAIVLFATMAPASALAVTLLVAAGLAETLVDASRAACGARQRQHLSAVVLVIQRFSALVLAVGVLLATSSVWWTALGYLLATCVGVVGMHIAAHRAGVRLRMRGSRAEVRMILEAAPVMGLGAVASMGMFRIDAALIGIILGTTAVGVYGAGYRVFETVLFVSWTLSRAYVPVIASRPDDREHVRLWAQRSLVVVAAIYVPYGVLLATRGDDLVGLLFGPEFVHRGLMWGLAAAPLLFGVSYLASTVLLALRPYPVVLVSSVVALAVNVGLNLWLIPRWGLTAAAFATSFAFLVESVIVLRALVRIVGQVVSARAMLVVGAASAAVGVALETIGPLPLALAVAAVGYLLVAALVVRRLVPTAATQVRAALRPPPAAS